MSEGGQDIGVHMALSFTILETYFTQNKFNKTNIKFIVLNNERGLVVMSATPSDDDEV
jgi:hypothetical protein